MTTIYLVRHAQAEGNLQRAFHGHTDGQLTPHGLAQLERLAERFREVPLAAIYSSDLTRAVRTAQAVGRFHPALPIITTPRLREIHAGDWEGMHFWEIAARDPEAYDSFEAGDLACRPGGGESLAEVAARMQAVVSEIAAHHPGETVAAVSHGCALRTLLTQLCGQEVGWSPNTSVSLLEYDGGALRRVVYTGDASHLDEADRARPRFR